MDNQKIQEIIASCDHTLLKVDAPWEQVRAICDDAVSYGTASVCIPPSYAKQAVEYMKGQIPVCVVIGFPNGYSTTASKVFEARDAIENGASEVDMVINVGWVKDGLYDKVLDEIRQIKKAVGDHVLKVIIETCLLTEEEKIRMCEVVTESGADFIKTSTGFSTAGATFEDVKLMKEHVGPGVQVKAAGGISTPQDAVLYYTIVERILGPQWLTPALFRIGASSLAGNLLNAIVGREENYF